MKRTPFPTIAIVAVSLAVLGTLALAQQDKYTVQVPGGLAFSEFRGYEAWQVVSVSQDGGLFAAILANPAMIDAYSAGIPATAGRSPTAPRWRKYIGTRKAWRRSPQPWCRARCMTSTPW